MQGKGKADPIDAHIGAQLRKRRQADGLNQTELAKALGVTFQQVQKYERGANRISGSMMHRASRCLGVEPNYFFPDVEGPSSEEPETIGSTAKGRELSRLYLAMPTDRRESLIGCARALLGPSDTQVRPLAA